MVITVVKLGFMEEQINHVKSVGLRLSKAKYLGEALTGALTAKNKSPPYTRMGVSFGSLDTSVCLAQIFCFS